MKTENESVRDVRLQIGDKQKPQLQSLDLIDQNQVHLLSSDNRTLVLGPLVGLRSLLCVNYVYVEFPTTIIVETKNKINKIIHIVLP